VSTVPPILYAQWRTRLIEAYSLRDANPAAPPPERLLQGIWHHQRLLRDRLRTLDGRTVRVLHPGFWNHEGGPDFRNAVLQFDSPPAQSGDVEIDLHPSGWRAHGHDRNPAFRNVALHVVWEAETKVDSCLPTLAIGSLLDAPVDELRSWIGSEAAKEIPSLLMGRCSAPLRDLAAAELDEMLRQAATVRLHAKATQLRARARQAGWEQTLWEGLFRALGYKHNAWPMQSIAELLPHLLAAEGPKRHRLQTLQARLFGVSGLLPADLVRGSAAVDNYLRAVWDVWWREREELTEKILPRQLWRFHGLRPANHPLRRLALAAHWISSGTLVARLEKWFTKEPPQGALLNSLLEILQIERDDFWARHWTFRSARMAKPQPLIGAQRVTDLAMNVILPWFWARGAAGKSEVPQRTAEQRYFAWPRGEDNALLRLARQRLLGGTKSPAFRTAAAQQGLLQIIRDFCDHSNAICDQCQFPDLVKTLRS